MIRIHSCGEAAAETQSSRQWSAISRQYCLFYVGDRCTVQSTAQTDLDRDRSKLFLRNTTPTRRLRAEVDNDQLSAELVSVVEEAMQPVHASLWIAPQALNKTRIEVL